MRFVPHLWVLLFLFCFSLSWGQDPTTKTLTISSSHLALMESTLSKGTSTNRMAVLQLFKKGSHVDLYNLDKNLWSPLKESAQDPQEEVRAEAVRCLGLYWIWSRGRQDPQTIDFLVGRMKDETRGVKYNILYYGLGKVKNPSPELVSLMIGEALSDHEPNYYQLLLDILKKDPMEYVQADLERRSAQPTGIMRHDAALFLLYRDILASSPPQEWGLNSVALVYMRRAYLFSVKSADEKNPMTHNKLWERLNIEFPTNIYLERYRDKVDENGSPVLIIQINGNSGLKVVYSIKEGVEDLELGSIQEFPPAIRIFYEEQQGNQP
jgi:hypothetical protein